ncbi:MAG: TIGR00730 family Rossman fold protein [bacterium]|nr:TIGR00730 family Rossman fold protein [bacterium]
MTNNSNGNEHRSTTLTREEASQIVSARIERINAEFKAAFELIKNYPRSVSIFGSARVEEGSVHYERARSLAARIVKDLGYAIITGGGGGIMEAANRGARDAGGQSVGLNIRLPKEQQKNAYTTDSMEFTYFFVRKVALSFAAEAYIFLPGGFGTLDEFFEILTLIQTHKIRRIPIILVGRDYWEELHDFMFRNAYRTEHAISKEDMELYTITDDDNEIIEIIRKVPVKQS